MSDRDHARSDREDADRRFGSSPESRPRPSGGGGEARTWSSEDARNDRGRGGDTPYGRLNAGSQDRPDAGWSGGGYGDQGGFGSQHGQGGYASPAEGSRYGQTGSEWGRSGYGSESGRREPGPHGGGEAAGFGATSYAAERDSREHRSGGAQRDYGVQGQAGGRAPWAGRDGRGEGGYGQGAGDAYAREENGGSAERSQFRSKPDDDHEPHYRRWREQQLDSHDRDYSRWRAAQSERYDDEYRSYRDQRHDTFSRDFGDWRDKSRSGGFVQESSPTLGNPQPSATASAGGDGRGETSLTAADDSLRHVTDGGAGRHDRDKDEDKRADKA